MGVGGVVRGLGVVGGGAERVRFLRVDPGGQVQPVLGRLAVLGRVEEVEGDGVREADGVSWWVAWAEPSASRAVTSVEAAAEGLRSRVRALA